MSANGPENRPAPTGEAEALEPMSFPLRGSRLIEASAGTGKTYTIAALYVRLVLGHGGANAYVRPLTPPEILVVTFTDAATQELRERIRARLAEAARCFLADPESAAATGAGDDFLLALRADYPPEAWPGCAGKLQLAAEWMDEAAVSTIHGWCHRMLREHAFDSGSLFTQTLETDQNELLAEVVRDYWRTFMVPLDLTAVAEVRQWWPGPDELWGQLRHLLNHVDRLSAADEPAAGLQRACVEKRRRLAELKAPWLAWVDELQVLLDEAVAHKRVNGRKLQARYYQPWLQTLRQWQADPEAIWPDLKTGWTRLTPEGLQDAWTQGKPPQHPALEALAALQVQLAGLPNARNAVLCHATRWVAERFAVEQSRRAQMGFNDLLTRLAAALQGPNGGRLAEIMRKQFPVALIDEFQDTDPVQYRIFDGVYRVADPEPDTALILIGDPKQAIYAFRGADIYTYLAARRACGGRLYTLKKNFRATVAMVAAANRCFEVAEQRDGGEGAFLFRSAGENPVPFVAAEAQGRAEEFTLDGAAVPALTAWCLPPEEGGKPLGKTAYGERMAAVCASEMVRLLNLGQAGRAGWFGAAASRPLRPADLAVLVNDRNEAEAIRGALAARGVRSVYLSDRDSVYDSPQSVELQHWLAACADPDDGRLLRAALATATLGLSWAELDTLNQDELAWEARVLQFRGYRECWQRQGVLPMLRRLLNDFQVPARLLGQGTQGAGPLGGERILTDVLHLAELLQQASPLLDGEHALMRYLAEQRGKASTGGDVRQIRLESDADLVQVVTVHKSKGLEYPLVFLPFVCNHRPAKLKDLPLKWHDEAGTLQLALDADDDILARADRDRLGEDLRKLYVALTRARYATWIGIAPLKELEHSAFGYLLGGGQALAPDALAQQLEAMAGTGGHIAVVAAPVATEERLQGGPTIAAGGAARRSRRVLREHWWIASYSALNTADAGTPPVPDTPGEDVFHEALAAQGVEPEQAQPPVPLAVSADSGLLHGFPKGAEVGSFLHDLLEWASTQGFAQLLASPDLLRDTIARRCAVRGWEQWIEVLTAWLKHFLATPWQIPAMEGIPATAFTLAGLKTSMAEMEFWLAVHRVDTEQLDRLVCTQTLDGAARPPLQAKQLNGMLKGFIDLVFEHAGRYYVIDYKSNWLGPDDAAYTPSAMRAEVLQARYELQYVLYLFALHRLLRARLPDYDYDRHIGAAVYLFLRGSQAPGQGMHVERPPRALIEALDGLFARQTGREVS